MSEAWIDEARALRESGLNIATVARRLDLPYNRVYYVLNRERVRAKQDRKVTLTCPDCGIEFERLWNRLGGKKCYQCSSNRKRARVVTRTCRACGEKFETKASNAARGGGVYCSRACWRKDPPQRSPAATERVRKTMQRRQGKANPAFKHGRGVGKRIRGFSLADKGEDVCRNCQRPAHHAHHAVPRSLAPAGRRDLRNCLPLCASCHRRWHCGHPIPRMVFTEDEWAFISTLATASWLERRYPDHELALIDNDGRPAAA